MSFDALVKTKEPDAGRGRRPVRGPVLVVGGRPAVSLLPPEVRDAAQSKVIRRGLVLVLVGALVTAVGGIGLAGLVAASAQEQLAATSAQTPRLAAQLAKFADVQKLQKEIALGTAAVKVGSSTEVDWQEQIDLVERSMPTGYTVTGLNADSASPLAEYAQGTGPLDRPRAATINLTVSAPDLSELPGWLRDLRSIPSYADATASVGQGDADGYSITVLLHLSKKALVADDGKASGR